MNVNLDAILVAKLVNFQLNTKKNDSGRDRLFKSPKSRSFNFLNRHHRFLNRRKR